MMLTLTTSPLCSRRYNLEQIYTKISAGLLAVMIALLGWTGASLHTMVGEHDDLIHELSGRMLVAERELALHEDILRVMQRQTQGVLGS